MAAEVERWMVPALFGKQGKAIKKLSQSMGGIVLKVDGGVCRGRASTPEAAREATRKLEKRVRVGERSTLVREGRMDGLAVGSFGEKYKFDRINTNTHMEQGGLWEGWMG